MRTHPILRLCLTAGLLLPAASCVQERDSDPGSPVRYAVYTVDITAARDPESTRSTLVMNDDGVVNEVSCFAFDHSTGKILTYGSSASEALAGKSVAVHWTGADAFSWELPIGVTMDVYAVVNYGEPAVPATVSELKGSAYEYTCTDVADLSGTGIPMAGRLEGFRDDTGNATLSIPVERIVARYDLSIIKDLDGVAYTDILAVRIRNVNPSVGLFTDGCGLDGEGIDGDYATAADLRRLNDGAQVPFYMLENCATSVAGAATGGGIRWYDVYDSIGDTNITDRMTHLEIEVEQELTGGQVIRRTCLLYLGGDCVTDFDIPRNTAVTLNITIGALSVSDSPQKPYFLWDRDEYTVAPGGSVTLSYSYGDFIGSPSFSFSSYPGYMVRGTNDSAARTVVYTCGASVEPGEEYDITGGTSDVNATCRIVVKKAAVDISFTDCPPEYDWQLGYIDLSGAGVTGSPVTAAIMTGSTKAGSVSCGSVNASWTCANAAALYLASEQRLYYYTNNGERSAMTASPYSIVLSQDGHSGATVTPDTREIYFALDPVDGVDVSGTRTEPTVQIDERGIDNQYAVTYYDKQSGSWLYTSDFAVPAKVRSAFPSVFGSEDRESYLDYTDEEGTSYFGYEVDSSCDDTNAGYITLYGLHPGTGKVWLNSTDGMYPCRDMCVTVVVGSVAATTTTLTNRGYFHCSSATDPDSDTMTAALPWGINELRFFENNTVIPDSSHNGEYWWDLATDESPMLENISYSRTSRTLTFSDPAENGGWYPTGSYIGLRTTTTRNAHTGNVYTTENYVAFQIIQDIPYGLGCRFHNDSGTDGSSTFSWTSRDLGVNIMPYITAAGKRSAADWDECVPSLYAKSYFTVSTTIGGRLWSVSESSGPLMNNQSREGDCPEWFYVDGIDADSFQISGSYPNGKSMPWTVSSAATTRSQVLDKLGNNAYCEEFRNIMVAPGSSPSSWSRSLTIDATHYAGSGSGGYYHFYCIYDDNDDEVETIENYFSDWSNY